MRRTWGGMRPHPEIPYNWQGQLGPDDGFTDDDAPGKSFGTLPKTSRSVSEATTKPATPKAPPKPVVPAKAKPLSDKPFPLYNVPGIVERFDDQLGYGSIRLEDGRFVFVHFRQIVREDGGFLFLRPDMPVTLDVIYFPEFNRWQASNVRLTGDLDFDAWRSKEPVTPSIARERSHSDYSKAPPVDTSRFHANFRKPVRRSPQPQ